MKIVVIIPAYNEEKTISKVIKEIPKSIEKIDEIKTLVINDGSCDQTVRKAKKAGADYIIENRTNRGLAFTFKRGLEFALEKEADIIVNIDADYQYDPKEIPKLVKPVLENEADMVVGNRQIKKLSHMSFIRKKGNLILSWFVSQLINKRINDVASGFRAFSKKCVKKINIDSNYTYTHEITIQAIFQGTRILEVPIKFRERKNDKSRLIKNILIYFFRSIGPILRTYFRYKPNK